ncbi:MAG: hypothetical protein RIF41_34095 [Polyangiaceae bacterium]
MCVALEDLVDRGRLAGAMRRLAERLEDAPRLMRDLGVDPSVVGDRERPIANVARELAEVEG